MYALVACPAGAKIIKIFEKATDAVAVKVRALKTSNLVAALNVPVAEYTNALLILETLADVPVAAMAKLRGNVAMRLNAAVPVAV